MQGEGWPKAGVRAIQVCEIQEIDLRRGSCCKPYHDGQQQKHATHYRHRPARPDGDANGARISRSGDRRHHDADARRESKRDEDEEDVEKDPDRHGILPLTPRPEGPLTGGRSVYGIRRAAKPSATTAIEVCAT